VIDADETRLTTRIYPVGMRPTIRTATTDADLERVLAVRNSMEADQLTLAGLRAERAGSEAELDLLAEADGKDVGAGSVAWGLIAAEHRNAYIFAWVPPEYRHQGIGTSLLDRLIAFARERGMVEMSTLVYDHETDTIAYLERRGLQRDGGGQLGKLELSGPETDRAVAPVDGIDLVPAGDRSDLERQHYGLHAVVRHEVPTLAHDPMPSFEAWRDVGAPEKGYLTDLSIYAVEGERLVGAIDIFDGGDGAVFIGMMAVQPDARRRGIARLMKVEVERRARAAGKTRIDTFNDGTNQRIRGLNESLGYVYNPPYVSLRGPLPPPRGVAAKP
jgi:GNAT superfamily N-acetyltransferase